MGSYELFMVVIRSAQTPTDAADAFEVTGTVPGDGLAQARPVHAFENEVAAGRVPSVRAIRAWLHVGQSRAQRVCAYVTMLASR